MSEENIIKKIEKKPGINKNRKKNGIKKSKNKI